MEKILYADDDVEVREIAQAILVKEGYDVLIAKDGNEAVNLAREKPDLVILDYMMPGKSGIEACQELKKNPETKSIPVLIVTAHPSEKERALQAGAIDFITKPVDKTDLLHRIKSVLRVRAVDNELQKMIAYISELEKK